MQVFLVRSTIVFAVGFMWTINGLCQKSHILVDQFGYLPNSKKIAILREPKVGYDNQSSYSPDTEIHIVNAVTKIKLKSLVPKIWNNGATHSQSGDRIWHLDFSEVKTNGTYFLEDVKNKITSYNFKISEDVYTPVLKAAFKTMFYQRAGFKKEAKYAGSWADEASHLGPLQDKNCRLYNFKNSPGTEKDLSGGWYDAGDYNKYTPWTADYVITMLTMYLENKKVWTDDFGIPESGNGIPDLIDEIKWGMDWLLKMNQSDGSSLCVVGVSHASPPSNAKGQSLYGPATTNATFRSSAAFALGALVFSQFKDNASLIEYAKLLASKAEMAYSWGNDNPKVTFDNNSASNGSQGLAAGNQETNDLGRLTAKMRAALYCFKLTSKKSYLDFFEANITSLPLIAWSNYVSQYFQEQQDILLEYTTIPEAKADLKSRILSATQIAGHKSDDFIDALSKVSDPYLAFIKDYNWGSNRYKSLYGNYFLNYIKLGLESPHKSTLEEAPEHYLHYIHGVNPFNLVYLSNMYSMDASASVNEFYHTWFNKGNPLYGRVGTSTYGPAPGFLVGGPNSSYALDGCCPNNCGSSSNNAQCNTQNLFPPLNQPAMKSFKDFSDSWPKNSWQITENSNGYQLEYIRLLANYVKTNVTTSLTDVSTQKIRLFPNPVQNQLNVEFPTGEKFKFCRVYNNVGLKVIDIPYTENQNSIQTEHLVPGIYTIQFVWQNFNEVYKIIKI